MIPSELIAYVRARVKFLKDEDERIHTKFAMLSMVVANSSLGKKKRAFSIKDFMPKKKKTIEEMFNQVKALNELFGGEDKRSKNGNQ